MTRAGVAAAVLLLVGLGFHHYAWGDAVADDVVLTRSATAGSQSALAKKFAGSVLEISSYIGSGSFYVSGYHDPYVSIAAFARPTYNLGTRYKLSLNARIYFETELTEPDNPVGRHFYPYDPWLWLSAQNLHTFERSKIRIGGLLRTTFPVSYESRYQHLLFGVGAGLNVNRAFRFGYVNDEARRWTLALSYGLIFYKYVQSSEFRGSGPDDTSGCRAPPSSSIGGATASDGDPSVSDADRCGGPANPDFAFSDLFIVSLSRGKWTLVTTLVISNTFEYNIGDDQYTAAAAVARGRVDSTWGIVAVSYQVRPRVSVSVGLTSLQPALDATNQYPRFPFFDLSGGLNANNFTQVFASINGSL